jgi:hypothetical protein
MAHLSTRVGRYYIEFASAFQASRRQVSRGSREGVEIGVLRRSSELDKNGTCFERASS